MVISFLGVFFFFISFGSCLLGCVLRREYLLHHHRRRLGSWHIEFIWTIQIISVVLNFCSVSFLLPFFFFFTFAGGRKLDFEQSNMSR